MVLFLFGVNSFFAVSTHQLSKYPSRTTGALSARSIDQGPLFSIERQRADELCWEVVNNYDHGC
jgi:hypothetical protein